MGKKKKNIADKTRNKKKESEQKINPFEIKVNKQKQKVLGRKISKHDHGMPGLSRSKGIKKRKATLLQEYNQRFKSNRFVDKRFGEHDTSLSIEEKMMKRFAMERAKEKTNKFSLNEEDDLTHFGQSLSAIEKFEEPQISDEDDEDPGKIDAEMVAKEHFGGFMTSSNYEELGGKKQQSWKERMEEVIAKSKKEKFERQAEKEKQKELTEKLDAEWEDVMQLMSTKNKRGNRDEEPGHSKADDYDIAVRELKFEIKGKASDRLKSEEELAKEEKERLDKLEADRMRRMKGITEEEEQEKKKAHFSADDLNDGFALDVAPKFHARYKDGKMITEESSEVDDIDDDNESDDKNEDKSDDENEDKSDDENDNDDEEDKGDDEEDGDESEAEESNEEGDEDESDDDSYKDIESDNEVEAETDKPVQVKPVVNLQKKKEMMDAARKELPYTFPAPENYEDLLQLLQEHNEKDQLTIITRLRKCHHVSLAEGNKQKLEVLFSCLLQYFGDLALQQPPQLTLMDSLVPHLYELSQSSSVLSAQALVDQISERQEEFQMICQRKGGKGLYPALDTLMLLKLVSVLFPTSDFRHAVTTPAFIFITQMLAETSVKHERDVAAGLFLCSLCLEYVSLSKRYVPECLNFLHGLLFLASIKDPKNYEPVIPPFKPVGKFNDLLVVTGKCKVKEVKSLKMSAVLSMEMEKDELSNNDFRLSVIKSCVTLLKEFSKLYEDLPSYKEIFCSILNMLDKLPTEKYPETLKCLIQELKLQLSHQSSTAKKAVVMQQRKPKSLKMFEPRIEEVFEDKKKKKKTGTKEQIEQEKLKHKFKKELKGAMREIRKDTQFLARQQLKEQQEKDAERKRKVKEIHQMLSSQEGDYNAAKRARKSKNPF